MTSIPDEPLLYKTMNDDANNRSDSTQVCQRTVEWIEMVPFVGTLRKTVLLNLRLGRKPAIADRPYTQHGEHDRPDQKRLRSFNFVSTCHQISPSQSRNRHILEHRRACLARICLRDKGMLHRPRPRNHLQPASCHIVSNHISPASTNWRTSDCLSSRQSPCAS